MGGTISGTGHAFIFHGTGREYFGIWVVNILLTIVTLGIYSAWAKVRNKRYFNGNTELAGHRFDYHARPMQILIGRIVVVVFLAALSLLQMVLPVVAGFVLPLYLVLLPWVIVRGLAFNANMTSYRNVRFHFTGTKWGAFVTYLFWPYAALVSLLTLTPFASRSNARFLGNGHAYGSSSFAANPPLKPYYKALGMAVLVVIATVALFVFAVPMFGIEERASKMGVGSPDVGIFDDVGLSTLIPFLVLLVGIYAAYYLYAAHARNNGYNHLKLEGGHTFGSTLTGGRYAWIVISNLILTIITLTLYTPWAKVRVARYLADNTYMVAASDLDGFVEGQVDGSGVASGEFLTLEGYDLGL